MSYPKFSIVVIGRNEGERLRRCLDSLMEFRERIVYIDSGSSDGSVELARTRGIRTVVLSNDKPFSAARARNQGVESVLAQDNETEFIQFVDGDSEISRDWFAEAFTKMRSTSQIGFLCGIQEEANRNLSIYARLMDLEWKGPMGEVLSCTGNICGRVAVFQAVNGYNESLIAGEDPDLCFRLKKKGWIVQRIPVTMARHHSEMTRFSQWWWRNYRGGYAYILGHFALRSQDRHYQVKDVLSNFFYGFFIPILLTVSWPVIGCFSFYLLVFYLWLFIRLWIHCRMRQLSLVDTALLTFFTAFGKFPQSLGQAKYMMDKWSGHLQSLIEYRD